MSKLLLLSIFLASFLSMSLVEVSIPIYAQSQTAANSTAASSAVGDNIVSVSASVSVQVNNETMKTKEVMLRSAVVNFLTSGPNVLKTTETDQPKVNTKILNQISNDTQSVQGTEATGAIVGVEVSKALKSVVSTGKSEKIGFVTIQTSSSCKPVIKLISCENIVTIK